jgi:hypothetical protein
MGEDYPQMGRPFTNGEAIHEYRTNKRMNREQVNECRSCKKAISPPRLPWKEHPPVSAAPVAQAGQAENVEI